MSDIAGDWKDWAEVLVVRFDDALPNCRMCTDYIIACHAEFPDIPARKFHKFMAHRLQSYRRNN